MKVYVLYHANCMDGFAAAWAAWLVYGYNAQYKPVAYGEPPPEMAPGSRVFVLDFSYKRDALKDLIFRHEVTVLDHHRTAEAELAGLPGCYFDATKSGAMMAWEFFHGGRAAPPLIQYVQDRDLWRWRLLGSRAVNAYLASMRREFEIWEEIAGMADSFNLWRRGGEAILCAQDRIVEAQASAAWLGAVLPSMSPAVIANVTAHQSETCELLLRIYQGAAFAAVYRDNQKTRQWSLRSRGPDFDVSEIARAHGGGGHPQAAGFEEPRP